MENIILPFREANNQATIVPTEFYPEGINQLQSAINSCIVNFPDKQKAYNLCMNGLLQKQVKVGRKEAHIQLVKFGTYNLVFVNMNRFECYPYNGIKSVTIDSKTKVYITPTLT